MVLRSLHIVVLVPSFRKEERGRHMTSEEMVELEKKQ